jgi:putative transposase
VPPPIPNWKGSLAKVFNRAHQLQRQLAKLVEHHGSKKRAKKTVAWMMLKRELKRCWKRIRHVHEELAKQVATRIVAACEHFGVELLRFEDLSWSRHAPKRVGGYWLASWQVHWFHSRIQQHATLLARIAGIAVEKVHAAGTSQRCSYCGKKGNRDGKQFTCTGCGRSIDSDLNGARNVAIAPRSRHGKAFLPGFNVPRGKRIQATMMSPLPHSPGLNTPKGCAPVTNVPSREALPATGQGR